MSSLALVLSSSLLVLTDAVETLTYTTSNPVPSSVTCTDPTGCEINCNGDHSCSPEISQTTHVYCPDNAKCTITATGTEAASYMFVHCGTNGICDITGRGDKSLYFVYVFAETSTKVTVTADGGYRSFMCALYCPQNQPQPSCFARVRSDSSPYFTSAYVMINSWFRVDSINDIEFQCDANTDWAALFDPDLDNSIFYYSNTDDPVCTWEADPNYLQNDFFNTNSFICLDGYDTNIMNNKRCVPWDTDTVTSMEPTPSPSKLPTQLPSKTATTPPSSIPTKPPSTTSTLQTEFPTIVLSTPSTPTEVPSKQPTQLPSKSPAQSAPSPSPTQETNSPSKQATQIPSKSPTQSTKSPFNRRPIYTTESISPTQMMTSISYFSDEEYRTTATINNDVSSSSMYSIVIVSSICVCISSIGCILGVIFYRKRVKQKEIDINALEDIYHDEGEEKANNKIGVANMTTNSNEETNTNKSGDDIPSPLSTVECTQISDEKKEESESVSEGEESTDSSGDSLYNMEGLEIPRTVTSGGDIQDNINVTAGAQVEDNINVTDAGINVTAGAQTLYSV